MWSPVIHLASAEPHYSQALYSYDFILYAIAALRRTDRIISVVVAMDIQKRSSAHSDEKAEIFRL